MRLGIGLIGFGVTLSAGLMQSQHAFAQPRGDKNFSVVNYLGRFHGIGYSDGYHACPDGNCGPRGSSQGIASGPQLYDVPSTVAYPTASAPLLVQDNFLGLRQNNIPSEIRTTPVYSAPVYSGGSPGTNYSTPSRIGPTYTVPPPPITPEPVRPVPAGPLSPSDSNPRMRQSPAPLPPPIPAPNNSTSWHRPASMNPLAPQSVPPGTHSLLRQSYIPPANY